MSEWSRYFLTEYSGVGSTFGSNQSQAPSVKQSFPGVGGSRRCIHQNKRAARGAPPADFFNSIKGWRQINAHAAVVVVLVTAGRSYHGETISLRCRSSRKEQHIKGASLPPLGSDGNGETSPMFSARRLSSGRDAASPPVSRTGSRGRYGSSSSPTGPNKECPSQGRASSTSSVKCIKPRSSSARTGPSRSTVGESRPRRHASKKTLALAGGGCRGRWASWA